MEETKQLTDKLSPRQAKVIKDMQNGSILITDCEIKGAWVSSPDRNVKDYHINSRVFWNLVKKGIIYQGGQRERFNYILTLAGTMYSNQPQKAS